jgi:catechol 2,3-dioxygenase-like lactoylglutathione lyase family enzyme
MTVLRMDNVGIVVDDLKAVTAFFVELGLELEGEGTVEGRWVDRIVGLDGVQSGSSRKITSGSPPIPTAKSKRRRWPPESVPIRAPALSASPASSNTRSASNGRGYAAEKRRTASITVIVGI